MNTAVFQAIKDLVRQRCGLVLDGIAEDRLRAALQRALQAQGQADLPRLQRALEADSLLFDHLVSQLTINETYFFREPHQIELCVQHILPRLQQADQQRPLRVLSAGCSSGEEPYSLAMALEQHWGPRARDVQIDACDLDRPVLDKARAGRYTAFSFRGVDHQIRERFFLAQGRRFELRADIRQRVNFFELNLLAPVWPTTAGAYDLILFRNVSIYFDPETRARIQRQLADRLHPGGILIVGSTETLANDLGILQLTAEREQYYLRKCAPDEQPVSANRRDPAEQRKTPSALAGAPLPATATPERAPVAHAPVASSAPALDDIRQAIAEEQFALASRLLDQLLSIHRDPDAQVLKAWVLANRQSLLPAATLLQTILDDDPWNRDALVLRGMVARWLEEPEDAREWLRKAVYICPDCWPAQYSLAETHRQLGNIDAARRCYQIVQRILASSDEPRTGLRLLPLQLSPRDLHFLCEHQLRQLEQSAIPGA